MAEFDTFDTFLVWFENQKPEWRPVLAARIALRALPLAFAGKSANNTLSIKDERTLLQLFRAVLALDGEINQPATAHSSLSQDTLRHFDSSTVDQPPPETSSLATLLICNVCVRPSPPNARG